MENRYTKLFLIILLFLGIFQSINAQKAACGTPALTNQQRKEILVQRNQYEKIVKSSRTASDTGITYLPVRINIFRNNDQTQGLSLQEMNDGMSKVNNAFIKAGKGIQFYDRRYSAASVKLNLLQRIARILHNRRPIILPVKAECK